MNDHWASEGLPPIRSEASRKAKRAKNTWRRLTAAELAMLVLGAGFAATGETAGYVLAAVTLLGAALVRLSLLFGSAQAEWLQYRAVTEDLASQAWELAVGSSVYPATSPDEEVFIDYAQNVAQILIEAPLATLTSLDDDLVTPAMRNLRGQPFEERRAVYDQRFNDQLRYYTATAAMNKRVAHRWRVLLLILEIGAAALALLALSQQLWLAEVAGLIAATAAGIAAWTQAAQHSRLMMRYAATSNELRKAKTAAMGLRDETAWADWVSEIESLFVSEHGDWRRVFDPR